VSAAFLAGGGDMGARIRAHDWSRSPLADPSMWPPALKTLAALMLASQQPMFIDWGSARTWSRSSTASSPASRCT